ncbi:tRNA (adenosine(37)-N6)-dimethylallyltransferase MiaA [Anaerosalibacter sp. Marseille-P3206]|uniref:tRNA (adenosine(37)-N6)-dimethylallyltransferase MiaA n=1 Tax=Anaerosalibacter sp. Marseille-P3206 TaxID=1871005 RepID=UPI000BE97ED0|nr:tRNA (adenosine(37)-N6)-dimethylallyltransferase MiaA [Anaerosalibacter sp. Marseille-P3206]
MAKKIPLFLLVGPTGIGKTAISISLAKKLNGEIVSADSAQIYKYMNIGTAKITKDEMSGIPHYLIDIVYPDEEFTVSDFKENATKYIYDIHNINKLPMVVGGTGLYINSLVYDLSFTQVPPNYEFREKYEKIADKYGNEFIYNELKNIDPDSTNRIHINDRKRIIRALEIYYVTKKPMSIYYKDFRKYNEDFDVIMIGLNMKREELYRRINYRVDKMIENGLVEEVRSLLDMGYSENLNSLQALGYKEIISYIKGDLTLDESIDLIKRSTRKFAKRQLTWFRRDNRIKWIDLDSFKNYDEASDYIFRYVVNLLNKN